MLTAARIIPRPPATSKYFDANIVVLLCALALLSRFHCDRLPGKEHAEYLPEDQFFRQQGHRQRKDHASYHCHECDFHWHNVLLTIQLRDSKLLLFTTSMT